MLNCYYQSTNYIQGQISYVPININSQIPLML